MSERYETGTGQRLTGVHLASKCAGQPCVIHAPSDHHMVTWPTHWRADRALMERICPHGIGHPDPDHMFHVVSGDRKAEGVHGCDGCCAS